MRRFLLPAVFVAAVSVSGCAALPLVPVAIGAYCVTVSEAGKAALREMATNGVQLVHCDRAPGR